MDAVPETQMPKRVTTYAEHIRVGKRRGSRLAARIDSDGLASLDDVAVHLDFFECGASPGWGNGQVPHEFFDGLVGQTGFGAPQGEPIGMLQ